MPLARGIVELFEAIPDRIEVSGSGPTWRVTGGSFDSVVTWVNDAFDDAVVIAREDRSRWWPRVTLTVTTDPALVATAPPLEAFSEPDPPEPEPDRTDEPAAVPEQPTPAEEPTADEAEFTALEDIFASQEEARLARRFPEQRRPGRKTR
jgi:hypothetical protein